MGGGCLAARWEVWESWGAEAWVVQTLKVLYQQPFESRPPLSTVPLPLPSYSPNSIGGVSSGCLCGRLADEGCHRTGILGTRLLQPLVCYSKGHGLLAACDRPFLPQSLCPALTFSYGKIPVSPPVSAPRALDGIHRPSGCVPPGSCLSGILLVPMVLYRSTNIPVSGCLFWTFDRSASVHPCHGPDLLHYALLWLSDPLLPGRLARPRILFPGDHAAETYSCGCVRSWGFW